MKDRSGLELSLDSQSQNKELRSEEENPEVAVGNLIDFTTDSEDDRTPVAARSPAEPGMTKSPASLSHSAQTPTVNGDQKSLGKRLSFAADTRGLMSSGIEENFEGHGSSCENGTGSPPLAATSLLISPMPRRSPLTITNGSSNAIASQLYSHSSRRNSVTSDTHSEHFSVVDSELQSELTEISNQMSSINSKLCQMEEGKKVAEDKHVRLKQENAVLKERINALEEQMQQNEDRWSEKYKAEQQKNRELQTRIEREHTLQLDSWHLKYQMLDKEQKSLAKDNERMQKEMNLKNDRLEELVNHLEELQACSAQCSDEKRQLELELRQLRDNAEEEIASSSERMEELSRENLQLKRIQQMKPRTSSTADRTSQLENELEELKVAHRQLQTTNEELSCQLLQVSVEQGHNLLISSASQPSLAEEMNGKDKNELINSLKEQEVCNQKLRAYIEGILIRVIEKHPDILEIKPGEEQLENPF